MTCPKLTKGMVKWATKIIQLVLQRCCKMS